MGGDDWAELVSEQQKMTNNTIWAGKRPFFLLKTLRVQVPGWGDFFDQFFDGLNPFSTDGTKKITAFQ
jgi:hypothetical protein